MTKAQRYSQAEADHLRAVEAAVAALPPIQGAHCTPSRGVNWRSHLATHLPKLRNKYPTVSTPEGLCNRVQCVQHKDGWMLYVDDEVIGLLPTKTDAHCIVETRIVGSWRYDFGGTK